MKLEDSSPMPFGKFQGKPMEDVPSKYLLWLWDNGVWQDVGKPIHEYIKNAWSALINDCKDYVPENPPK